MIITLIPSRIIAQYLAYCSDIEFEPASERTLFKILEVCSASMQKSLHGLDYITTDGASTLRNEQAVSSSWEKECKQQLVDEQG